MCTHQIAEASHLSYLIISHDLAVVRHMPDRIGLVYLGQTAKTGPARAVCAR